MAKVWIATDEPVVDESMTILKIFSNAEAADKYRESKMVRVEGLQPWDTVFIEEWEVDDGEATA